MTTIAFIGLGIMGLPMAKNLVDAGFTVRGFNRTPAKAEDLAAAGGQAAATIAEAVDGADVIATMVPDSPDVEAVLDGILAAAKPGATWIDFSTIRPDVAKELAAQAKEAGLRPLDAPVSGGEPGAVDTASALEVLGGGLAGSKVLEQKGQKMLDREFAPGFRLALHHKDMGIVTAAAREAGVTIPLGAAVAQLVAATVAQGNGGLDHSGLLTVVEQLSGTTASAEDEDADAQEGAA